MASVDSMPKLVSPMRVERSSCRAMWLVGRGSFRLERTMRSSGHERSTVCSESAASRRCSRSLPVSRTSNGETASE